MTIIKLDATDSTNDFLKQLAATQAVENFTVVTANQQLKGKGQMGAVWKSESGKNLTFSILVYDVLETIESIYTLNVAVAVSVIQVLQDLQVPNLKIKWPNDIMSANKKIGGILIENVIKSEGKMQSIIGIGLNVNQKNFDQLPQASSMYLIANQLYDCEKILLKIIKQIEVNILTILQKESTVLWDTYHQFLYKKDIPSVFENANGIKFMGIIQKVVPNGQLEVLLEDDSIVCYSLKEVKMLY